MTMPVENLKEFNAKVKEHCKRVPPEQIVLIQKKMAFEGLRRLVVRTPVDTGRARGNWQTTLESPAEGQVEAFKRVESGDDPLTDLPPLATVGQDVVTKGFQALAGLQPFSVVWITNNLPYIERLEHGHSQQGKHMMKLTVQDLLAML